MKNTCTSAGRTSPLFRRSVLAFLAVFSAGMLFALVTNHAWEDWYITYRISKNLATGAGLVYTAGERIHAFTSPIGVLVPAFLAKITGATSDSLVIWLFRVISCAFLGMGAVILVRMASAELRPLCVAVTLFLYTTSIGIIDFSINGMETAFMVFFTLLTAYYLSAPSNHQSVKLGAAWAGLLWTRPDGFVPAGALALGFLLFAPPCAGGRQKSLVLYLKAAVVTAILYAPWLMWAQAYYGSFIPHTVTAKGLSILSADSWFGLKKIFSFLINCPLPLGLGSLSLTFMPPNAFLGGWWSPIFKYAILLATATAFYWVLGWIVPLVSSRAKALSIAALVVHMYLSYFNGDAIYAWYLAPAIILGIIVLGFMLEHGFRLVELLNGVFIAPYAHRLKKAVTVTAVVLCVMSALIFVLAAYELRIQQRVVETGNRRLIGLWLKEQAQPHDRVFLEPLGYIGFYSGLKMFDSLGLCSEEVVQVRRQWKTDSFARLIAQLQPEWVVLRPAETESVRVELPGLLENNYELVKVFDVSKEIDAYAFIPGRGYLRFDQTFEVFKKRKEL